MELIEKSKIIEEFTRDLLVNPEMYDPEDIEMFLEYNDLGIPLAQAHAYDLISGLTEEGSNVIEETWFYFCNMIDVDPDGEYDDLDEVLLIASDDEDEEDL